MDSEPFHLALTIPPLAIITFIQFGLVLLLLLASALISGAEVAFFSLNIKSFDETEIESTPVLKNISRLLKRPKRLLATILVANNFINIALVLLFSTLTGDFLAQLNNPILELVIEVGVITLVILIFGELLPKIYANRNALSFSKIMAGPINFLDRYILFWITQPMSSTTRFIENRLGQKTNRFSVDHLSQALELTDDQETTKEEQRILEGIINFGNTETRQVMCPRIDVFALSDAMQMSEIIPKILDQGFSRIPVYSEKKDNIRGILYVKDLLPNIEIENFDWFKLLKAPFYVPENKKLDDLLREFQQKKIHMAIVVDEYGGTSGLITLEDIMEEIVGDISDEFDEYELSYTKLDRATYVFEAKISLKDFFRVIALDEPEMFNPIVGDAETIAGLVLEIAKKFPTKGQIIKYAGFTFTIEEIDKKRITQIKVKIPQALQK